MDSLFSLFSLFSLYSFFTGVLVTFRRLPLLDLLSLTLSLYFIEFSTVIQDANWVLISANSFFKSSYFSFQYKMVSLGWVTKAVPPVYTYISFSASLEVYYYNFKFKFLLSWIKLSQKYVNWLFSAIKASICSFLSPHFWLFWRFLKFKFSFFRSAISCF